MLPGLIGLAGFSGGAAGLFEPDDLSSLKAWLDADDISKANGAAVAGSDWVDRMGAITLSGGDAANPTMVTNAVNGHKALNWAGTIDGQGFTFGTTFLGAATQGCYFAVAKRPADTNPAAGRGGPLIDGIRGTADNAHWPYEDGKIYEPFGSTVRKDCGNPTPSLASTFRLYSAHSAASDFRVYLDGTVLFSTVTNTVGMGSGTTRRIAVGAGGDNFNGQITALLFFDNVLSTGDRQKVEGYLAHRYGIQAQLPGAHPYLSDPPTAELGDNVSAFRRRDSGIYVPNRELIVPDRLAA